MQFLFRLSARLPLSLLHALGAALGWLVYLGSPTYRRRFHENIVQAGVPFARARGAIAGAGRLASELPWIWLRPPAHKQALLRWEGAALLEAALAQGKGAILMTPHLGCFEVIPQAQMAHFGTQRGPMMALYRPAKRAWFDALLKQGRSACGLELAPASTGGVRMLLKALKQGRVIGMLPDQVPPEGLGVWAPFFGRPAYTMTLALRLAQQTGAPLLMTWGERLPGGRGYVIHVEPLALPLDQPGEVAAAALNAAMEQLILKRPDAYLWGYARYKQPREDA
ncbi:lysophospholipid acyltransferase family protein [Variovorax terrae]|uniref:Lysophospholipid acyltransferase family protein n=1 Tax=Variovorax terrae TaxID=2923278 RepID=A0A9X1VZC9_9BURK|nr:lysophospholipid acyltransferase family protein [Variovorax terrae]MCJ0764969.1 lysophospholipid acyltransferase family protein [Variovorax terrae]